MFHLIILVLVLKWESQHKRADYFAILYEEYEETDDITCEVQN